jgi:hypothetical protein
MPHHLERSDRLGRLVFLWSFTTSAYRSSLVASDYSAADHVADPILLSYQNGNTPT